MHCWLCFSPLLFALSKEHPWPDLKLAGVRKLRWQKREKEQNSQGDQQQVSK